ncbi:MAG TPA: NAD(P)-dependent oxidoreductase [Pyrinomonadaceae bacterium]|nr:NAD(P)-dependent oxidoreductase [Pyrinomonadaceae bacterium]
MRRVLILGAGQVGTFAASAIVRAGAFVVAADLTPAPGYFARYGPSEDVELLAADILNATSITKLIKTYKVDTVVLTAGLSGRESASNPIKAHRLNVESAETVGEVVRKTGVGRLVFLSTFAVYGNPSVQRITESVMPRPQSEYGRTKLAAEAALTGLRAKGVDVRILRPCGIYGPLRLGMGSQSARLFESLLVGAVNKLALKVQASSTTADEYLYVKDLGRAIAITALANVESSNFIFNAGAGRVTTARQLCQAVRLVVPGARVSIEAVDAETASPLPLDVSLIRKTLGFEPEFSLVSGLTDYLREANLKA